MKSLLISFLLILSLKGVAQKLQDNYIDDFKKIAVKRTSWEVLNRTFNTQYFISCQKIDSSYVIGLKMMLGKVFSIGEKAELLFKTDDDSVITAYNTKYVITCTGCGARGLNGSGAEGINADYFVSHEDFNKMLSHVITKVRIYTSDGYVEFAITKKVSDTIIKELTLVQ